MTNEGCPFKQDIELAHELVCGEADPIFSDSVATMKRAELKTTQAIIGELQPLCPWLDDADSDCVRPEGSDMPEGHCPLEERYRRVASLVFGKPPVEPNGTGNTVRQTPGFSVATKDI